MQQKNIFYLIIVLHRWILDQNDEENSSYFNGKNRLPVNLEKQQNNIYFFILYILFDIYLYVLGWNCSWSLSFIRKRFKNIIYFSVNTANSLKTANFNFKPKIFKKTQIFFFKLFQWKNNYFSVIASNSLKTADLVTIFLYY